MSNSILHVHVCAVSSRLRKMWEAWSLPYHQKVPLPILRTVPPQVHETDARHALVDLLQKQAVKDGWANYTVHWFDPYKNFSHGDTAYQYIEDGNTDVICTFLAYEGIGDNRVLAKVRAEGRPPFCLDPRWLKPISIRQPWSHKDSSTYSVTKATKQYPQSPLDTIITETEELAAIMPVYDEREIVRRAVEMLRQCRKALREAKSRINNRLAGTQRDAEAYGLLADPLLRTGKDETPAKDETTNA